MNDSTPSSGKTACPKQVIACGATLLAARRKASEATGLVMEAFNLIDEAAATLPPGLRMMQLGEPKALLIDAMKTEHLIAMAHDLLRKLLGEVGVEEPTNAQLANAKKSDGGPIILGGGGGGR
jgi:hypothetical protein